MTTATESLVNIDRSTFAEDPSPFDITTIMEVEQSPSGQRVLPPPNTVRVVVVSHSSPDHTIWKLFRDIPASEHRRIGYSVYFEAPDDKIGQPGETAATESLTTPLVARSTVGVERELVWTDAKNERRCQLIDREIAGTLSATERVELEELQSEMLAYRRRLAPLPLDEMRRLHQNLLRRRRNDAD